MIRKLVVSAFTASVLLWSGNASAAGLLAEMRNFSQFTAQVSWCLPSHVGANGGAIGSKLGQIAAVMVDTVADYGELLKPGTDRNVFRNDAVRLFNAWRVQWQAALGAGPCPFAQAAMLDGYARHMDVMAAIAGLQGVGLELLPYDKPSGITGAAAGVATFAYPATQDAIAQAAAADHGCAGLRVDAVSLVSRTPKSNVRNIPSFVLPPVTYKENWHFTCAAAPLDVAVTFTQDSDGGVGPISMEPVSP